MTNRKPYEELAFPMMNTVEAIKAADYLSEGEKELAISNLKKIPRTDGFWVVNNNPELALILVGLGFPLFANCGDGPLTPGKAGQVIHFEVARLLKCDALMRTMIAGANRVGATAGGRPYEEMLTDPDNPVWTDDERMGIKFARALVENNLTPELRAEALELWGPQGFLSYIVLTTWAWMWATIQNAVGLKWEYGTRHPAEDLSPEETKALVKFYSDHVAAMKKYWAEVKPPDV